MIRESILREINRRFPTGAFRVGGEGNTIAVFPSKCPDVGDVTILDYGDEAIVLIEDFTHGHFNPYDESLSEQERDKQITEEVCDFLEDLFADKVLLWRSASGRSGGWRNVPGCVEPEWVTNAGEYYLWSGHYKTVENSQPKNEPYSRIRAFWKRLF